MDIKIAICLPANMGVRPQTLQSLLELVAYKNYNYEIFVAKEGFTTGENRNLLASKAVKAGCSHTFFVDADMIYLPETLEMLLEANKDIIGGSYHVRHEVTEGNPDTIEYLDDEKSESELFKCKALGGGCLLIKTEVFKKLKQPHFWYEINEVGMVTLSNDWYFCYKAREAGYDIWCHPAVYPAHIGKKAYV